VSAFVPGRELSRRFYEEQVRPVIERAFPGLPHGAALLGRGSEVLGFDDEMSGDHDWQPRVLLFLEPTDHARHGTALTETLRARLPASFHGHPPGHTVTTVRAHVLEQLAVDVTSDIAAADWLTFPEQNLRMLTAGAVFHDDVGLGAVRERFAHYPHDVWLYLMLATWWRLSPEANLVGRAGFTGDELGSALIGSQLVQDAMRLSFLQERQYAPYSKWFATAFALLARAPALSPVLRQTLLAQTWQERENALLGAYGLLAAGHDALGVTDPVPTQVLRMWDRPFQVLWGDFPGALQAAISDPAVLRIAQRWPVGGIERVRDLFWAAEDRRRLLHLLE